MLCALTYEPLSLPETRVLQYVSTVLGALYNPVPGRTIELYSSTVRRTSATVLYRILVVPDTGTTGSITYAV